jgi:hypothetical protein
MWRSFLKRFLVVSFIIGIFYTPICDISCNTPQIEQKTTSHCQHHQPKQENTSKIKNTNSHSCDYLHKNAEHYLKYNLTFYNKSFDSFYLPLKEKYKVLFFIFRPK